MARLATVPGYRWLARIHGYGGSMVTRVAAWRQSPRRPYQRGVNARSAVAGHIATSGHIATCGVVHDADADGAHDDRKRGGSRCGRSAFARGPGGGAGSAG